MSAAVERTAEPVIPPDGQPEAKPTSQESSGARDQTVRRLLLWVALYAVATVLCAKEPVTDFDIWWHLRTGEWIVEHGTVPTTDPFSAYGQGRSWHAYSWLFELLVHGAYTGAGLLGILVLRIVVSLAVVLAVHRLVARWEPSFVRATALTALALVALAPVFQERSWLFSILLCALTLDVLLDLREGRANGWTRWLPVLYALGANLHIQFVNGLFLLGLACAAPVLEWLFGRSRADETADTVGSRGWRQLVLLTGACTLATLVNPYTVWLYLSVIELPTQAGAYEWIAEMQALAFRSFWEWAILFLTGLACFALGRRERVSVFDVLLLASSAFLAFRARRDLWVVVLAALALTAGGRRATSALAEGCFSLTRRRALVVAAAIAAVCGLTLWRQGYTPERLDEEVARKFPAAAASVVEARGYAGPLYNHYNWGGYLIWRLPHLPVALDGRSYLHGDARLGRSFDTWEGRPGWDADAELLAARLVIAQTNLPLSALLRLDPRWDLVHQDEVACVFVAKDRPRGQSKQP